MATTLGAGHGWNEVDRELALLSHVHRRSVLRYLCGESTDTATLDELATHVRDERSGEERDSSARIEIELYHLHLPKMDDAGLIEFDADSRTVSRTNAAERALELLDEASGPARTR